MRKHDLQIHIYVADTANIFDNKPGESETQHGSVRFHRVKLYIQMWYIGKDAH